MKKTSPRAVLNLARDITVNIQGINSECETLQRELKSLQNTFLDDGIDEVESFVSTIQKKISDSNESLETIVNGLIEYSDKLQEGK